MNKFEVNHKKVLSTAGILLVLALISVLFFDHDIYSSINFYLHHGQFHSSQLKGKSFIYEFVTAEFTLLGFVAILIIMMLYDSKRINSNLWFMIFIVYQAICLIIINYAKIYLKYFFARCVPEICYLPEYQSMVDLWGFHWFSFDFASFPSGHSMFMGYCFLWSRAIPSRFSNFVSWVFVSLVAGMILFNYHFLGDCLAGSALGLMWGSFFLLIWSKIRQCATNQAP